MALLVVIVMMIWGGGAIFALFYARDHLSDEALQENDTPPMRAQIKGRLVAFGTLGLGLLSLGAMTSAVSGPGKGALWPLVGAALLISSAPLLLPTGKLPVLGRISAVTLVTTSVTLSVLSGVALAAYYVLRLILTHPEVI